MEVSRYVAVPSPKFRLATRSIQLGRELFSDRVFFISATDVPAFDALSSGLLGAGAADAPIIAVVWAALPEEHQWLAAFATLRLDGTEEENAKSAQDVLERVEGLPAPHVVPSKLYKPPPEPKAEAVRWSDALRDLYAECIPVVLAARGLPPDVPVLGAEKPPFTGFDEAIAEEMMKRPHLVGSLNITKTAVARYRRSKRVVADSAGSAEFL